MISPGLMEVNFLEGLEYYVFMKLTFETVSNIVYNWISVKSEIATVSEKRGTEE